MFKLFPTINYDLLSNNQNLRIVDVFRAATITKLALDNYIVYRQYNIQDGDRPDIASTRLYGVPDYHWTFAITNDFLRDGYHNWPLSQSQLDKFASKYMMDTVISVRPRTRLDQDGLFVSMDNCLVGRFNVGERITGNLSGASGIIKEFDYNLQQLLVTDVTGFFRNNELITGENTADIVTTFEVNYLKDAPCEYVDNEGKIQTNVLFYPEGISNANLYPVSYFEKICKINADKSLIKIISPDYIVEFVNNFKDKINE